MQLVLQFSQFGDAVVEVKWLSSLLNAVGLRLLLKIQLILNLWENTMFTLNRAPVRRGISTV